MANASAKIASSSGASTTGISTPSSATTFSAFVALPFFSGFAGATGAAFLDAVGFATGADFLDGAGFATGEAFFVGVGFEFLGGKEDGRADFYGDARHRDFSGASWQSFVRAKDAHGLDRHAGFCGDHADARCGLADLAIEGALTFWENQHAPAFLEMADRCFHGAGVRLFLIDGDRVPLRIKPFPDACEEGFAGEVNHLSFVKISDERRIEKTLMIRGDENSALVDEVFTTDDSQAEESAEG